MKGLIAIPTADNKAFWEFVDSYEELIKPEETFKTRISKTTIHVAREIAVNTMLRGGYDWIFFIDDDMAFPPDTLERLLSHNAPVVSAMAFKRTPPYTPAFYKKCEITPKGIYLEPYELDEVPKEPFNVEACGAACMLIRREVFEKVGYPWFTPPPFCGEDIYFCTQLKKAGIPILIDPKPIIGHIETRPIDVYTYLEEQYRTGGAGV